jgi:hypothetical protein
LFLNFAPAPLNLAEKIKSNQIDNEEIVTLVYTWWRTKHRAAALGKNRAELLSWAAAAAAAQYVCS